MKDENRFLENLQKIVLKANGTFKFEEVDVLLVHVGSANMRLKAIPNKKSHQYAILKSFRGYCRGIA